MKGVDSLIVIAAIAILNDQGYYAVICYGWREAAKVIEEYLLKADNDKAAAVLQEMGK